MRGIQNLMNKTASKDSKVASAAEIGRMARGLGVTEAMRQDFRKPPYYLQYGKEKRNDRQAMG